MGLWIKNEDGSIEKAAGGGGDGGPHDHDDYLPLEGGVVTGDLTVDGNQPLLLRSTDAAGREYVQFHAGPSAMTMYGGNDANYPNEVRFESNRLLALSIDGTKKVQAHGDLQVDSDVWVGFRIKSEYTRDNPTASGATNVHLSDNGYFYKTTMTRGGPFAPSKLTRSEDVLVKAETATLPPEMETDDGGNILNTAEIEAHDTVQLFDVVTALLAKVKQLSARIEDIGR